MNTQYQNYNVSSFGLRTFLRGTIEKKISFCKLKLLYLLPDLVTCLDSNISPSNKSSLEQCTVIRTAAEKSLIKEKRSAILFITASEDMKTSNQTGKGIKNTEKS